MDERFLRNEMLWGKDGQARLTAAHVIVFGLGGVGSYVAECLARAGVGELTLVDSDTVALSNLNRQLEALDSTVGLPKAEAVAGGSGISTPMRSCIPWRPCTMPTTGNSSSLQAAGMTILWTPLIW